MTCLPGGAEWSHLIFLELAQCPHCTQVPAGAATVWKCAHDLLDSDYTFGRGWRGSHGWGSIGDPGAPVILQGEPRDMQSSCCPPTPLASLLCTPAPAGPGQCATAPLLWLDLLLSPLNLCLENPIRGPEDAWLSPPTQMAGRLGRGAALPSRSVAVRVEVTFLISHLEALPYPCPPGQSLLLHAGLRP